MATKFHKVTKHELLSLHATADTVLAISNGGDLEVEAKSAKMALKTIENRNTNIPTRHYMVTASELLTLVATVDTVLAISGGGDDELEVEAKSAKRSLRAIEKRNGISLKLDYSDQLDNIRI